MTDPTQYLEVSSGNGTANDVNIGMAVGHIGGEQLQDGWIRSRNQTVQVVIVPGSAIFHVTPRATSLRKHELNALCNNC